MWKRKNRGLMWMGKHAPNVGVLILCAVQDTQVQTMTSYGAAGVIIIGLTGRMTKYCKDA